jgi:hypothetical protein
MPKARFAHAAFAVRDRVINLSTNYSHIQRQPQRCPNAIASQNWNIQPYSQTQTDAIALRLPSLPSLQLESPRHVSLLRKKTIA